MTNLPLPANRQAPYPDGDDPKVTLPESANLTNRPSAGAHFESVLLVLFYLAILGIAIGIKWTYRSIDAEAIFRDSASYAKVADAPLNSLDFWAGWRPFTLPLFYKLLGVGSQNYKDFAVRDRVAIVQAGISILCWGALGLTLSRRVRNHWLGGLIFGFVLAFSLVYEISRWDLLLLSETLSFCLFALLLSGWILLLGIPKASQWSPKAIMIVIVITIVGILYAFARSPNSFFLIMCAVLFAAASLIKRTGLPRALLLINLTAVIFIFLAQNASSNIGNRWQIFLYDHFALRLTDTPEFVDYFTRAGLTISEDLYLKPGMRGSVYEDMLMYDPKFEPVRQWTNEHGKATYIGYLLSYPKMTLGQPLTYATQMLNGTAEEVLYHSPDGSYRTPFSKGLWVPRWLRGLTKLLFPTFPVWIYGVIYAGLLAITGWAFVGGWDRATWLVIAALLITMYPMMVLIWWGDPLEPSRHALQVAVGFRLAGWLALAMTLERLINKWGKKAIVSMRAVFSREK